MLFAINEMAGLRDISCSNVMERKKKVEKKKKKGSLFTRIKQNTIFCVRSTVMNILIDYKE